MRASTALHPLVSRRRTEGAIILLAALVAGCGGSASDLDAARPIDVAVGADAHREGGPTDSGPGVDTGVDAGPMGGDDSGPDSGTAPHDAGTDSGTAPHDAGTDSGTAPHDAGLDSGTAPHDAGTDSGTAPHDAGADAGPATTDSLGLDPSGTVVPDTNYAIPSGAIFMAPSGNDTNPGTQAQPVLTIDRAITLAPSGGTIVARGGTYRDWYDNGAGNYRINTKQVTLQAYPHEQVWFDGTDVVPTTRWTSDGAGHWYTAWSTPSFCDGHYYDHAPNMQAADNTGPCTHRDMYDAAHPVAGDPQNAFVDGVRQAQVGTLAGLAAGSFYYDFTARRIYLAQNPSGHTVELAARPTFMVSGVSAGGMVFRGLGIRRFASNEYSNLTGGALFIGGGGNNVVENCAFTQMSAQALSFASPNGAQITHDVFAFNGFNGVGGNGHAATGMRDDLVLRDSLFNHQNLEHYGTSCSLSCASAHIKFAHLVGWTVRHNVFEHGDAVTTGVWCDTSCSEGTTVNNLIDGTDSPNASGIHYEINFSGRSRRT